MKWAACIKKGFSCIQSMGILVMLLAGACKPAQPSPATPPGGKELPSSPVPGDSGLQVVDQGQPLAPSVVGIQPAGGQELPLNGEIALLFDQDMETVRTGDAWTLVGPEEGVVTGKINWSDNRTMHFKPHTALDADAVYLGVLEAGAASSQGVPLVEPLHVNFQTTSSLQVSQVFPQDGSKDVASNAVITAIFNHPVVPLTVAGERDQLPDPLVIKPPIGGRGEWVSTSVYAFQPGGPLKGGATYQVTVKAGTPDAAGETQLAEDYSWEFTTITPSIQSFQLSSGAVNPEPNLKNVLLDEYFTVNFNQPMDVDSSATSLALILEGGDSLSLKTRWNEDDTGVTITPTLGLELDTTYTLVVDTTAKAVDGEALAEGLNWSFSTIPAPSVLYVSPPDDQEAGGFTPQLRIKFASPMDIESVKKNIVISPQPQGEIQWWYDANDWSISAFVLQPSTNYQVRTLPGMQDIYGNIISSEKAVRFTTPAAWPQAGLQMPSGPALLRVGGPQEFYVTHRNVGSVDVKLYQVTPQGFLNLQSGNLNRYEYSPPEEDLVWESSLTSTDRLNERVLQALTPVTASGKPLDPGFYFLVLDTPDISHPQQTSLDNRLVVVAGANLTFKTSTNEGLVWLTDLESGKPLDGASLVVYDKDFQPIGEGSTDKDGLLKVELPDPEEPYDPRYVMTSETGPEFAFTTSQWGSGVNLYDYGIWSSYYAPSSQPRVYAYTDRPIYRPDQPVYYKGILRFDDDLAYSLPEERKVHVKISNYKETVFEHDLPLSEYGTFSGEFALDPEAILGYYNIGVELPGRKESIGGVGFTVAEYRRPEFHVAVGAEPQDLLGGQEFTVNVSADYYSGGGVGNARVDWTLNASPFSFSPPSEYASYSFEDAEQDAGFYEDRDYTGSEIVAQGEGRTRSDGIFKITLPADLSDSGLGRQFTFEATVSDLSKNAVSGRTVVNAHRSAVYPGIRPQSYVGTVDQEGVFEVVTLDWDGGPLSSQDIIVEIVERNWYSVQEQDPSGRVEWKTTVEETPVDSLEAVSDERGRAEVSFTPPKGGIYRAKASVLDKDGNEGRASSFMWVAGEDFIPWRKTNDRSFDLIADRPSYAPGDTAEVLIASPFQGESYALVTVERGRIFQQEVILLDSNSTVYKLPITADLAPNAYVSVVVVKGMDETNPRPNFKMGMVELQVDTDQQKVFIAVTAEPQQAGPGERVTYTIQARDESGRPLKAEFSLSLSDLATLSLLEPNTLPILDFFYNQRSLGVWTSIPLFLSLEDYNATISEMIATGEGMGSGGGKGEDELGVITVRQDFPDTAFWQAHIETDEDGQAQVTVTLPDNLTTWRMDARGVTINTRVGQEVLDLVSSKPLLVRPQTPRFFVEGDKAAIGTVIQNNTSRSLDVKVSLEAQGVSLESDAAARIKIAAKSQALVTWEVAADQGADRVDLVLKAEGGGLQDSSRPPQGTLEGHGIPVYRYQVRETVGTSGQMDEGGTIVEAISLPEDLADPQGEMKLQIAHSLAAGMTEGLTYLEAFPYGCIEQTISSFLPNVVSTRALRTAGLSDLQLESALRDQVNKTQQRLLNLQNPDGGWGWWPGGDQKSDALTTAYVVLGLLEAQDAGYPVSEALLDRAVNYLRTQIKFIRPMEEPSVLNRQVFLLDVLARTGKPNVSATVRLFDQRQNTAIYARAFLVDALHRIDPDDARIQTLLSDFNSLAIISASGTHWEETEQDPWNWNTDTRTTAIVLAALSLIESENPLNANAVRWLMGNRTDGHWQGTQETAWTLMALTNWMEASGELGADYLYEVALNGERLGGGTADRERLFETLELQVDAASMLRDQVNRLAIARDDGPGSLYYTSFMDISLPVDQVGALDQGITISRSYYPYERGADLSQVEAVTEAKQGDLLLGRLTLVVPNDLHYVVVEDPLPAGLEAVDQSLQTSPQNPQLPTDYDWQDVFTRGWGWWYFDHTQLRDEKVVLSASYLPAGSYVYTYLVRAGSAGEFNVIPPTAQEFYFPDVYGRGEGSQFVVNP